MNDEIKNNDSIIEPEADPRLLFYKTEVDDQSALNTISESLNKFESILWGHTFTKPIAAVQKESFNGRPIKLLVRVHSITEPFPILVGENRITKIKITLSDRDNSKIDCLGINSNEIILKVQSLFVSQKLAVITGAIISILGGVNKYVFLIHEINDRVTANDHIYVREDSKIDVKELFHDHLRKEGIFQFIKNTLVDELGIKGLDSAKELDRTIDFMIYQAFSYGKFHNASMRLHSLVIGAPGSGKKLLTRIALTLNPVAEEVSAAEGKVSMAGMVGRVQQTAGRTISEPGYLSLASGGVLCIQDFHEIEKNRRAILESFSKVMEDGEVIDSTSARTTHIAETSIHLDTNKFSQVHGGEQTFSLDDIKIPSNVITRFDYIIDIPADAQRQWEVAISMSRGARTITNFESAKQENDKLRALKRIVAHMVTQISEVEISPEIAEYKIEKLTELKAEYTPRFSDLNSWQGIFPRIAISLDKYLKAIAVCNFHFIATQDDVDLAISFIRPKLEFVSNIKISIDNIPAKQIDRKDKIYIQFNGQEVDKNQILSFLKENGHDVSIKTVERDLAELEKGGKVQKSGRSRWKFV